MKQAITITIIVVIALISVVCLFYPIVYKIVFNRNFKNIYYKKIKRLVLGHDWRLLNNFTFALDSENDATFDHIIFSDKYIYCLVDKYWHGGLNGKKEDDSWFFYPDNKSKCYIDNPLKINDIRKEKLSLITGLDSSIFISIVVINDDCEIDELKLDDSNNYIVKISKLKKLITLIEKRDVSPFNDEELQKVVYEMKKLRIE